MAQQYFAQNGKVYMTDGPWEVRLQPAQCDQLLGIFDAANAVTHFNALWTAMDAAGLCPSTFGRPKPSLTVVPGGLKPAGEAAARVVERLRRRSVP